MSRNVVLVALVGALTFPACDSVGQAMTAHTDVLARAAGHELTVDQAVGLLAPATRIPAQPEVVQAVADLWTDYVLLAEAWVKDSTLTTLNLDPVVLPYFNQQLVFQLRDSVIEVDTMFTDDELRRLFETEMPNVEVKARHILFRMPADAAPPVRDSVMAHARGVLQRAQGGADFAELAGQYTEEPQGNERGGDLGWFGPGSMVQPFEEAAFKLRAGEVSDLVETPFGIHIIKVEEKKLPDFEAEKLNFRMAMVQKRFAEAEEKYLTSLVETTKLEVQEGAIDIAKDLAKKPATRLSRRQASRVLVKYVGGGLTTSEYLALIQQRPPQDRTQVSMASDDQIREWLRLLARDEVLISAAGKAGLQTSATALDSARTELRTQLKTAAEQAGLLPIQRRDGESEDQAIDRQVLEVLSGIINGERNIVPLGALGFSLREEYGAEVFERAFSTTVARVTEVRGPVSPQEFPTPMPQPPPPTTGN